MRLKLDWPPSSTSRSGIIAAGGIQACITRPRHNKSLIFTPLRWLPEKISSVLLQVQFGHGLINGQSAQVDLFNHLTHLELMRLSTKQKISGPSA